MPDGFLTFLELEDRALLAVAHLEIFTTARVPARPDLVVQIIDDWTIATPDGFMTGDTEALASAFGREWAIRGISRDA